MNPVKIAAIILIISAGLISSYFIIKNFIVKNPVPASLSNETNDVSALKPVIRTPLQWVENVQDGSQQIVEEQKKTTNESSALQKLLDEIQVFKWGGLDFGPTTQKTTETVEGIKDLKGYWIKVLGAWGKNGFTEEEFKSIKKNKDGRVLSLEELIQEAIQGTNLGELRLSFKAWQMLDERTLNDLKNISVSSQLSSVHRSMISWFEYHSQTAEKLSKENLSRGEINDLFNQYLEKAKIEVPKFQLASTLIDKSLGISLISKAQAQEEEAFYHFGGLVVSYEDFCTTGFAVVIEGVKGGLLWIYYEVLAANPYIYHMLSPGHYVLGRAEWGPGICNKGKANYPLGIAQILFFGSSLE